MSKKIIALVLSALSVFGASAQTNRQNAEVARQLEIFNALYDELNRYYVDTLQAKTVLSNATAYMLANLDPYTEFYNEEDTDDLWQRTTGKYAGIGAKISYRAETGRCIIAESYAETPATEAGLLPGDVILAIDGKELQETRSDSVADFVGRVSGMLRGQPGTALELRFSRFGEKKPRTVRLTRRDIVLPTVVLTEIFNDSIGYIRLEEFREQTGREMRAAVTDLKARGARRLVLDLRDNYGGLVTEAVKVVNLFVPRGKVVLRKKGKRAENNSELRTTEQPLDTEIPLAVITNGRSASSSEITVGALQDYDRAIVTGQRTYGKGLVQESRELPYGAIVKLTTARYYIPSGRCVQAYKFQDGEPVHLPDSIARRFHTAAGRPVYDCGGITPDVILPEDSLPGLVYDLASSNQLFDYATEYRIAHPSIAPADRFRLTDKEYDEFCAYLKAHDFTYDRRSLLGLEALRKVVQYEGYDSLAGAELDALEAKLKHDEDADFRRWDKKIRHLAGAAIASRYYYARGTMRSLLLDDAVLEETLRLLSDDVAYRRLLSAPAEATRIGQKGREE